MSRSRAEATGSIARERLKLMVESETMEHTPAIKTKKKKEIADIIARYYEVSPDNYEIKVILKQNKKRA